ncbi:MAG: ABC transporter ATP-binding protein [Gaiellaceae bacterium]
MASTPTPELAIVASQVGVEYDLRLSPYRTLRQTASDLLLRRGKPPRDYRFWALEDVSFVLRHGESLGVVGRNGSGKSTLLLAMAGILKPDRGTMTAFGSTSALLTLGAGFEPSLSGRENIHLNAAFLGARRQLVSELIDTIIAFSELGDFIDVPLAKYSAGMRARLGFAIVSHLRPDILLLDEVLGVGDLSFRAKSERKLHELMTQASAIVVVSHGVEFVQQTCKRTLWLEDGRVAAYGDTEDVIPAYVEALRRPVQQVRRIG